MLDYYLFADQVPTLDPDTYTDTADLIRDLRFNTLDPFSSVRDAQTQQALFEAGESFGFGARFQRDTNDDSRVALVFADSPFGRANVKRGDIFVSLNGVLPADLNDELFDQIVGTQSDPRVADWEFIDGDTGESKIVSVAMAVFTINTVVHSESFTTDSSSARIGYLLFQSFLGTSEDELDAAIGGLADAGVDELVLDLRYNGGGFISVARRLAAQIAGDTLDGQTAVRYEHNDTYTDQNFTTQFSSATPTLNLSRVIVLTTDSTASASELVINALRPYIEVVTIGETTLGKPFISAGRNFCGQTINAMHAQGVNAEDLSVAGGIAADCFAEDDTTRNFGSQSGSVEGMLQSAIIFATEGTCDTAPAQIASRSGNKLPIDDQLFIGAINDTSATKLPAQLSKTK
jgi:C-terminal processing protease CtpA/Prc